MLTNWLISRSSETLLTAAGLAGTNIAFRHTILHQEWSRLHSSHRKTHEGTRYLISRGPNQCLRHLLRIMLCWIHDSIQAHQMTHESSDATSIYFCGAVNWNISVRLALHCVRWWIQLCSLTTPSVTSPMVHDRRCRQYSHGHFVGLIAIATIWRVEDLAEVWMFQKSKRVSLSDVGAQVTFQSSSFWHVFKWTFTRPNGTRVSRKAAFAVAIGYRFTSQCY